MTTGGPSLEIVPGFDRLLSPFDLDSLAEHAGSVYALTPDFRLAAVNAEWRRFAETNGAPTDFHRHWSFGAPVLEAISQPLRGYYSDHYTRALEGGEPWRHEYQCPSPHRARRYMQLVYPLGRREGLLVVHSLLHETPHPGPAQSADEDEYRDANGFITTCVHCRRTRHPREAGAWRWVSQWVERMPPGTSHGLCPPCLGHYYPDVRIQGRR